MAATSSGFSETSCMGICYFSNAGSNRFFTLK
jgi:hypothetical protein